MHETQYTFELKPRRRDGRRNGGHELHIVSPRGGSAVFDMSLPELADLAAKIRDYLERGAPVQP